MKSTLTPRFLILLGLLGSVMSAADSSPYPPHIIPRSELRAIDTEAVSGRYQLHIGLPPSYAENPDRHYPVVFVTDAYWDFVKMFSAHGGLTYDKVVPEFITVGLGYAGEDLNYGEMRLAELSPVPVFDNPNSGRAAEFLQTLKNEIIPFIEREYRIDPEHRVLAGASLGGLFTLYSMFAEPGLFSAYIAATPAVVLGDDWLLEFEEAFFAENQSLPGRLFVSGGGNEAPAFLGGMLRFNARMSARNYAGLAYRFRIIDGERHAGMQIESYTRGLRFVFEPLAPETGAAGGP